MTSATRRTGGCGSPRVRNACLPRAKPFCRPMPRLALLALAVVFCVPATAKATVPCRDQIYNDWYKDGKIASTYPIACYRDALKHVPADARTYSSLADDIRAAEQGAEARLHGR